MFELGITAIPASTFANLIRRDQHDEAARRFRLLIAEGLESGEGRRLTDDVIDELRDRALGTVV